MENSWEYIRSDAKNNIRTYSWASELSPQTLEKFIDDAVRPGATFTIDGRTYSIKDRIEPLYNRNGLWVTEEGMPSILHWPTFFSVSKKEYFDMKLKALKNE